MSTLNFRGNPTWQQKNKTTRFFVVNTIYISMYINWLVVSTHLQNISQHRNLPQIGVNIEKICEFSPPIK